MAVAVMGCAAGDQYSDDSFIESGLVLMVVVESNGQRNLLGIESCDLKSGGWVLQLEELKLQIVTAL